MINIFKHLLPTARAWRLTINKRLRQFFEGLTGFNTNIETFIDGVYGDINPQTTRELSRWENQFGLLPAGLTEKGRRDRLSGAWKINGGQDPQYIQDTMQAAGFDVYVYEWWEPIANRPGGGSINNDVVPVARNPFVYLWDGVAPRNNIMSSGHDLAFCGGDLAYSGSAQGQPPGYLLVNKILEASISGSLIGCGHDDLYCGGDQTYSGSGNSSVGYNFKQYQIPSDLEQYPYFIYIGGSTFPEAPNVQTSRISEFEDLLLKICPTEQWIGILGGGGISLIPSFSIIATPVDFIGMSTIEVLDGDFEVDWGDGNFVQYVNTGSLSVSQVPTGDIKIRNIDEVTRVRFTSDTYTDIDILDGASLTSFDRICSGLSQLTTFNAVNTTNITNCNSAWLGCSSLVSMPLIDVSAVTTFERAWEGCSTLTSFPMLNTAQGVFFTSAWFLCTGLVTFPPIDFSSAQRLISTWAGCNSLLSFPAINTPNVSQFHFAWDGCSSLESVGLIDTSNGVRFSGIWRNCTSLICISSVDTTGVAPFLLDLMFDNTPLLVAPNGAEQSVITSGGSYTNSGACP